MQTMVGNATALILSRDVEKGRLRILLIQVG